MYPNFNLIARPKGVSDTKNKIYYTFGDTEDECRNKIVKSSGIPFDELENFFEIEVIQYGKRVK